MYDKGPQQQAMQTFIHDHNRAASGVSRGANEILDWVNANKEALVAAGIQSYPLASAASLLNITRRSISNAVDSYYKEFNAFPDPIEHATPAPAAAPVTGVVGEAGILAMLDEMDKAKARATAGLHNMEFTLAERLDFSRGYDHAAANRFDVLAAAYRKLAARATPPAPGPGAAVEAGEAVGQLDMGNDFTLPLYASDPEITAAPPATPAAAETK